MVGYWWDFDICEIGVFLLLFCDGKDYVIWVVEFDEFVVGVKIIWILIELILLFIDFGDLGEDFGVLGE